MMEIKEKIEKRQENNIKLLDLVAECIEAHPELRFGQALYSVGILETDDHGIIDPFYEESIDMYDRIMNKNND